MEDDTVPGVRDSEHAAAAVANAYLIILSGHALGRMYKLEGDEVIIGRGTDADLHIDAEGISRAHAKLQRRDDGGYQVVDLDSTNGTYVEGERVWEHELRDGERIQVGSATVLKFTYRTELEEASQRKMYESATRDSLTSAYNRRFFDEHLAREISHSRRHKKPLSLLAIDIDHFKQVNDTHGHQVGDEALRHLGRAIAGSLRHEDVFGRVGGEEFAVIMRDADLEAAQQLAERLRSLVAETPLNVEEVSLSLTISLGVAAYDIERHTTPETLVEDADRALYEAKKAGRNQVCVA